MPCQSTGGGAVFGGYVNGLSDQDILSDASRHSSENNFLAAYDLPREFAGLGFISAFKCQPEQPIFNIGEIDLNLNLRKGTLLKNLQPKRNWQVDLGDPENETFLMQENELLGTWLVFNAYHSVPKILESFGFSEEIFVCPVTPEIQKCFHSRSRTPELEEYRPNLISVAQRSVPEHTVTARHLKAHKPPFDLNVFLASNGVQELLHGVGRDQDNLNSGVLKLIQRLQKKDLD